MNRRNSSNVTLMPQQRDLIEHATKSFPAALRHSIILRIERTLAISNRTGFVSDALIVRAIDKAIAEVVP